MLANLVALHKPLQPISINMCRAPASAGTPHWSDARQRSAGSAVSIPLVSTCGSTRGAPTPGLYQR